MRQVRIEGYLPSGIDEYWRERQLEDGLSDLDKYEQMTRVVDRKVLQWEEKDEGMFRHVKYYPKTAMPAIVQKALKDRFHYEELQQWREERKGMSFSVRPQMFRDSVTAKGEYFILPPPQGKIPAVPAEEVAKYLKKKPLPPVLGVTRQEVAAALQSYAGEWLYHYCDVEVDVRVPLLGSAIEKSVLKDVTATYNELPLLYLEMKLYKEKGGQIIPNEHIPQWRKANGIK